MPVVWYSSRGEVLVPHSFEVTSLQILCTTGQMKQTLGTHNFTTLIGTAKELGVMPHKSGRCFCLLNPGIGINKRSSSIFVSGVSGYTDICRNPNLPVRNQPGTFWIYACSTASVVKKLRGRRNPGGGILSVRHIKGNIIFGVYGLSYSRT